MKCVRCNNELKESDLYCDRCGTLVLDNPKNKIIKELALETYNEENKKPSKIEKIFKWLEENKFFFIISNIVVYIIFVIWARYNLFGKSFSLWNVLFFSGIFYFYIICFEMLFKKAGINWCGIFVPIYNFYIIFKLAFQNGFWSFILIFPFLGSLFSEVLMLVPGLGLVAYVLSLASILLIIFVILFKIGRRFNTSGIITMLFPLIIIPILAFDSNYKHESLNTN